MTSSNYTDQIATLQGRDIYDRGGDKIGSVGQLYADRTGQPTWASVHTGLFGMRQSMVPLTGSTLEGDQLRVPFDRSTVKDAPHVDHHEDEPLTADQVQQLYQHYNLSWDTQSYVGGYTTGAEHTRESFDGTPEFSGTPDGFPQDGAASTDMAGTGGVAGVTGTSGMAETSGAPRTADSVWTDGTRVDQPGVPVDRPSGTERLRRYVADEQR